MNNQRKESRRKLAAFAPVYDLLHKALIGYIGDLTPQGVMVIGEKPVDTHKRLTLGIEFPDDESQGHTLRIVIPGRAAWCRPDETPQYFNIGFEFLEISSGNQKIIDSILTRYQFRQVMDVSDLKS